MNTSNTLLILVGFLVILIAQAFIIARTAKSKGRSYALFLIFGLVSPVLTSIFAMALKPKNLLLDPAQPVRRIKLISLIGFVAGMAIEVYGLSQLPIDDTMTDQQIIEALGSNGAMGALAVAAAGVMLMIASVANERVVVEDAPARQ